MAAPEYPSGDRLRIFLNSPLADLSAQALNLQIRNVVVQEGFDCIFPQEILPPGPKAEPLAVLRLNMELIRRSDIVLSVLESPGEGVFFEMGVAFAMGKTIIAFRRHPQEDLGKVIEGVWQDLPDQQRASNIEALRSNLRTLRKSLAIKRREPLFPHDVSLAG